MLAYTFAIVGLVSGIPGTSLKVLASSCRGKDEAARKNTTHQDEDGKEYDNDGSCNEELLPRKHGSRKEKDQRKADGAAEASIGNDELIFEGQWNGPEPINDLSQDKDTCKKNQKCQSKVRPM